MGVADSLGWKLTTFANTAGIKSTVLFEGADNGANGAGEADPFLAAFGIEEVDGVDVEWSAPTDSTCGSTGKILKFVKKAAANTLPAPAPVKLPSGFDSNDSNLSSAETKTKLGYNKKEKAVKPAPSTTKKSKPIANSSSKESSNKSPTISDKSASLSISPSVMEGWGEFCLHTQLLLGLSRLNYVAPTPIQRQVLSVALKTGKCGMNNRDILGCAETGSGKTLAFGLPILNSILNSITAGQLGGASSSSSQLHALILVPTRELALQVTDHLKKASLGNYSSKSFSSSSPSTTHHVKIVSIVGGLAHTKQKRLLDSSPHIIVATPGRLWDLVSENELLKQSIQKVKFLVFDEADRMLESGHFKDLEMILDCMSITQKAVINEWTHPNSGSNNAKENKNEDEDDDNDNDDDDDENGDGSNDQQQPKLLELDANGEIKMESMTKAQLRHQHRRRTFLFSATLLPLDSFSKKKKKKNSKSKSNSSSGTIVKSQDGADVRTLGIKNYRRGDSIDNNPMTIHPTFIVDELVKRIQFCDPNPLFIDVISKNTSTSTGDDESSDFQQKTSRLVESKIDCLIKDKDLFLYYILMMYPGRSLVFVNSIDCIRRLVPLLSLLNVNVWGLHAEMQQRQRLKNLERFKESENSVLISSDVSARGIDIPNVDHVIHYQIPRTADLYVHRRGRTARGVSAEGVSVALCGEKENKSFKRILNTLKIESMDDFPVDQFVLGGIKDRVSLARAIDEKEHLFQKTQHEDNWLKRTAAEADLDVDEMIDDEADANEAQQSDRFTSTSGTQRIKIKSLKEDLASKLAEPLIPRGVSKSYITRNASVNGLSVPNIMIKNQESAKGFLLPTKMKTTAIADLKAKVFKRIRSG